MSSGVVAPSILSADFSNLLKDIREVESFGATWLHVDVMDGHFVPNMTIGPVVVESLRQKTKSVLDCHLMVNDPEKMIDWFVKAGADVITVHFESLNDPTKILRKIRASGKKAGISIKPKTKVELLEPLLTEVDLILIMSVEPGFGGQGFIADSLNKVKWLVQKRRENGQSFLVEIDGGINSTTALGARTAGVDVFVAGSAIFNAKDRKAAYEQLEAAIK